MKFCSNCGNKLSENTKFCGSCGNKIVVQEISVDNNSNVVIKKDFEEVLKEHSNKSEENKISVKKIFDTTASKMNQYTGEDSVVDIDLKDMFSEVLKKHTQEEAEEIFVAGTKNTTPSLSQVSDNWAKPWLFSRILLAFSISFVVLWYMIVEFKDSILLPGFIFFGAFTMPIAGLIFFFESNVLKNISLMKVFEVFFVGGVFSLWVTFILSETFPAKTTIFGELTFSGAITVGVVEEVSKLLIVIYYINKFKSKYILNGLLIGCAVGAGFAAFETAGYILEFLESAPEVTILRAITSIGGHLAYTAVAGGALVMVKKSEDIGMNHLFNGNFLFFFVSVVAMHSLWDMGNIPFFENHPYIQMAILIVAVWVEILVLMSAGLKQVSRLKYNNN